MAITQNTDWRKTALPQVAVLGTLPPLRAISSYCEGLVRGLLTHTRVEFVSFAHLYPKALYPGAELEDADSPAPAHSGLTIRRELSWYNPVSWIRAGLRLRSPVIILQWWSLPLAPVYLLVAIVARLRGVAVVTTLHNITPHGGRSWAYGIATRLLLSMSQRAIVHSERNARQLASELNYPAARTLVLPMGAADFRQGRRIDGGDSRRRLRLPTERPILLMFGSLRGYKGLDEMLDAMVKVAISAPDALLLVAGQPWQPKAAYRADVEQRGLSANVRLDLDFIPDQAIHDYFSAADMLLLPYTHFDAQSGVGVSALPYGLPIIVSDCGSLPGLVKDAASVVEAGNTQQLATRVLDVLGSPALRERLGADSAEIARRHEWNSIARELYRQLSEHSRQNQKGTAT